MPDFQQLFDFVQQNWATIKSAPGVFIFLALTMFAASFALAKWSYQRQIETLKERNNTTVQLFEQRFENFEQAHEAQVASLNHALEYSKEQNERYKNQLGITSPNKTAFTLLTNDELKEMSMRLVNEMREFIIKTERDRANMVLEDRARLRSAQTEEEMLKVLDEESAHDQDYGITLQNEYKTRFKGQTLLLRNELLSRLPKKGTSDWPDSFGYEHPANIIVMSSIADDLEKMAMSLPSEARPRQK